MKEVSKEELHQAIKDAKESAKDRVKASRGVWDGNYFYSEENLCCSYKDWLCFSTLADVPAWKDHEYKRHEKKGVRKLRHYMECRCDRARPDETAVCFATVYKDGKYRYFIAQHTVGQCPWKD